MKPPYFLRGDKEWLCTVALLVVLAIAAQVFLWIRGRKQ